MQIKKFRQIHQSFVTEGAKSVVELLTSDYEVELVAATPAFQEEFEPLLRASGVEVVTSDAAELAKLGGFQTNDACIAVAKTKENTFLVAARDEFVLVLDDIRDPGNLGSILRIADWYGFPKVVCSLSTTDFYNPKVIAASKGSFTRVQVFYTNLEDYLARESGRIVVGTFLEGTSLYDFQLPASGGYVVVGNESNGIGDVVSRFVTDRVTIPRFGGAESLNAGVAAAVVCDNIRRQLK